MQLVLSLFWKSGVRRWSSEMHGAAAIVAKGVSWTGVRGRYRILDMRLSQWRFQRKDGQSANLLSATAASTQRI
jgi:hypothetical protein